MRPRSSSRRRRSSIRSASADGRIEGRERLREHFTRGLQRLPDLRFELEQVYVGVRSIAITYRWADGTPVAELHDYDERRPDRARTGPLCRALLVASRAMAHQIVTLPGDGIGPEIMEPTLELLEPVGDFEFEEHLFGGASIDAHGVALTDEVLAACRRADAVLLAAVGGPKWDTTDPAKPRPEQGLLGLRKGLGLYANLRPVKPLPALYDASPLRRERIEGTDLLVVRELTGGIYFGEKTRTADLRVGRLRLHAPRRSSGSRAPRSRRARAKVTSVDKANVLETSRLWREVVSALHAREFPHVELEHVLVDNAAMQLVSAPRHFDTILTENMFGDILSDEAAMLTGSIGMLPSASLGGRRTRACSSRCTAPRPTSPGRASPIRWRCSSRPR